MSKKSRAKLWFLVHSWLALPIWVFVLIVCFTGTLAVVSQEIIWLAQPEVRASKPSADARLLDFDEVLATVRQQRPDVYIRSVSRPDEDHFALNVNIGKPDGSTTRLYVNPYTGHIQGQSATFDFRQFTRALHGWWLIPFTNGYSWGWYLVSFLGLPMLASLVTGLVVYKRFWKGFFKAPRLRHGARIFWGDLHRLSGVWSIWFIAVISITGTWFLIEAVLHDNHIEISAHHEPTILARDAVPHGLPADAVQRVPIEQAIQAMKTRVPTLEATFIDLPGNAYDVLTVGGRSGYPLIFQTAEMNPYTGQVMATELIGDLPTLDLVTESMRPLHTGDFGGLWIKLIWFFFGLVLTLMVFSGLLIWTKRTAMASVAALKRKPKAALAHLATTEQAQP
ncbi:MAG: PepSY domain-containing protein [Pseudomonas sp.]|uniref:PepSY-associated TM helix domain-containing protein n=1 Tax=Pseudomonas abieticivorans TaxID=2931382 RepID=UPI0020BF8055|nr:PepSY domain-containing protein [Pseudomonas sp. PIA16]MDE1169296.1 PepSY domain-containing protein [Pseudomonas sp.]